MVGKLEQVEAGITELKARILEQEARKVELVAEQAELKTQWAELCKRADVQGEDLAGDIGAVQTRQDSVRWDVERSDVVLGELRQRLATAQAEQPAIRYEHHKAQLAKLDAKDTPLVRDYVNAVTHMVETIEAINAHEAAKEALISEANRGIDQHALAELKLRRLPVLDLLRRREVGPETTGGTWRYFVAHSLKKLWPEPL